MGPFRLKVNQVPQEMKSAQSMNGTQRIGRVMSARPCHRRLMAGACPYCGGHVMFGVYCCSSPEDGERMARWRRERRERAAPEIRTAATPPVQPPLSATPPAPRSELAEWIVNAVNRIRARTGTDGTRHL